MGRDGDLLGLLYGLKFIEKVPSQQTPVKVTWTARRRASSAL